VSSCDKHVSLLWNGVNYSCKKFYGKSPRARGIFLKGETMKQWRTWKRTKITAIPMLSWLLKAFGHRCLCLAIWQCSHRYLSNHLKAVFTLAKCRVVMTTIMLVTATRDSHHCTCLGHLGWCDTDRIISIYVTRPRQVSSDCHMSLSPALSRKLLPV